jgi:hypothetical protein
MAWRERRHGCTSGVDSSENDKGCGSDVWFRAEVEPICRISGQWSGHGILPNGWRNGFCESLFARHAGRVAALHFTFDYLGLLFAQFAAEQFLVFKAKSVPFLAQVPIGQVPPLRACLMATV